MHYAQLSFPTLRFSKTAGEIKAALKDRITKVEAKREVAEKEIADLCTKWELSPDEVYSAGADEAAISTYSGKMAGTMAVMTHGKKPNMTLLQQAQAEMDRIPELGRERARLILVVEDMNRVVNNLTDNSRIFDLPYAELASLGF